MLYNGHPNLREEYLPHICELYEEQQLNAPIAVQEASPDYKVGDHVVVDLPIRTVKGKRRRRLRRGYRRAHRPDQQLHELINKEQFEDRLRQNELETEIPAQDEPEQAKKDVPKPA